jgi:hypothetical protein
VCPTLVHSIIVLFIICGNIHMNPAYMYLHCMETNMPEENKIKRKIEKSKQNEKKKF